MSFSLRRFHRRLHSTSFPSTDALFPAFIEASPMDAAAARKHSSEHQPSSETDPAKGSRERGNPGAASETSFPDGRAVSSITVRVKDGRSNLAVLLFIRLRRQPAHGKTAGSWMAAADPGARDSFPDRTRTPATFSVSVRTPAPAR